MRLKIVRYILVFILMLLLLKNALEHYAVQIAFCKASILANRKQYKEAMALFNFCERTEPRYFRTYHHRGILYVAMKNYYAAYMDFLKVEEMVGDYANNDLMLRQLHWKIFRRYRNAN